MNTLKRLLFHFTLIITFFNSCKEDCKFDSLPDEDCGSDYYIVSRDFHEGYYRVWKGDQLFIVNNKSDYKNIFNYGTDSMPLGYIDFDIKSLVCSNLSTAKGSDYEIQGYLCRKSGVDEWKFTVEYSMYDKCKGSGIKTFEMCACIITDKIPDTSLVILNTREIN